MAARSGRAGSTPTSSLHVEAEADGRPVAAEHRADFVVAAAAHQRVAGARRVDAEAHAAVVGIAAQVGQVEADAARRRAWPASQLQVGQRLRASAGVPGSTRSRLVQHRRVAVQRRPAPAGRRATAAGKSRVSARSSLASLAASAACTRASAGASTGTPANSARTMRASAMSTVSVARRCGALQAVEREQQRFEVGLEAGVAVDLGAELQRLARGVRAVGPRVQHRAAVAQARHALAVEQVRVDARDLRRGVGAQAHACGRRAGRPA